MLALLVLVAFTAIARHGDPARAADGVKRAVVVVGVAQALAERLERPLKLVWVTVPNRGGLGKQVIAEMEEAERARTGIAS